MKPTLALVGTLDTKGEEYSYIIDLIKAASITPYLIDIGIYPSTLSADTTNDVIAKATGHTVKELQDKNDRAYATKTMADGAAIVIPELYKQGAFDGIISFGGSGGSAIASAAMRNLPIGVPKLLVSTMASGDTSPYVGTSDIMMMPSIVDVAGLNRISTTIYGNAIAAIAGMLAHTTAGSTNGATKPGGASADSTGESVEDKPIIAATMFGVTTPCITKAQHYLEEKGYEVLVFHATGMGGKTMEALIEDGFIDGVLDITTTEWCDEIVGGVLAAGPKRNEAASIHGIPQVVSVGAVDMVNFGAFETVPQQFADRNLYKHNPTVTLMRTSKEENIQVGTMLASKLNMATAPSVVMLPLQGVSMIDAADQPFYGPQENQALFNAIKTNLTNNNVKIIEMDSHINDDAFAVAAADQLIALMNSQT